MRPPHVGSCDKKPVTCVIAKTNTRSKNSSSGVTACSSGPGVATSDTRLTVAGQKLSAAPADVVGSAARGALALCQLPRNSHWRSASGLGQPHPGEHIGE